MIITTLQTFFNFLIDSKILSVPKTLVCQVVVGFLYDSPTKDWEMDPKGYFLIDIDKKKKLLRVGYCIITKSKVSSAHEMVAEIYGKTAIEVLNTLIREEFISTLQHSGDMGIELCKAELALNNNLDYVQDKDLNLK